MNAEPKQAVPRPPLRRRTDRRVVAGVAGGMADWLNVDVSYVRLIFLFAAMVLQSAALIAYAAAAALMPPLGRSLPSWDNLLGLSRLGLLLFGGVVISGGEMLLDGPPPTWLPVAGIQLVGLAVLLTAGYTRHGTTANVDARARVVAALPPAAVVLAIGVGALLLPDFAWQELLPVAAVVAGLALMRSTRNGSWRAFVAPGVVTTCLVVGLAVIDVPLQGGVGSVSVTPTSEVREPIEARRAVGDVTVDLTHLRPAERPIVVEASTGVGHLRLIVSDAMELETTARVGRGTIRIEGDRGFSTDDSSALGLDLKRRWTPSRKAKRERHATVRIDAHVGVGDIEISGVSP